MISSVVLCIISRSGGGVEAYKNYTVGDSLGWYDTLEKPSVNYQKWVASKNFSLGDFLCKPFSLSLIAFICSVRF